MIFKKTIGVLIMLLVLSLGACATKQAAVSEAELMIHEVPADAEIAKIDMNFAKIRSESSMVSLFMNVTVKNNSSSAKRYVVTVFIPGAGSGQDFAPAAEGKKINPGETDTAKISIMTDLFPSEFQIKVQEDR